MFGFRADDIKNFSTGLGTERYGRSVSSEIGRRRPLSRLQLDTLWEQGGLAAKISEIPADDMVREGSEITDAVGVDPAEVQSLLEDVGAGRGDEDRSNPIPASALVRRLYWQGSHYGGALLMAAVNDGMPPSEPLDYRRIQSVEGFVVLDRHAVQPLHLTGFGPPEGYQIMFHDLDIPFDFDMSSTVVHASRVLKYNGPVDPTERRLAHNQYWGSPVLDRVWRELRAIWTSLGYAEEILHDMNVDVFSIPGLHEAVKAGEGKEIGEFVRMITKFKSVLRALLLDGGSPEQQRPPMQLGQHIRSATGFGEVLEMFMPAFVAGGRIPRSRLLGDTRGGMNSGSNEGEHRAWDSDVRALQRVLATPWLNWMLEILFSAKDGITGGRVPKSWTIKHNDLSAPTEAEQATTYKTRAEGDEIYSVNIGSLTSGEVRKTRHQDLASGPIPVDGDLPEPDDEGEPDDDPEPVPEELEGAPEPDEEGEAE